MEVVVKIAQLILSLSILVIIHELGHFTFAKIFKPGSKNFTFSSIPGFPSLNIKKAKPNTALVGCPLAVM